LKNFETSTTNQYFIFEEDVLFWEGLEGPYECSGGTDLIFLM
jgi:hypothetical protein